MPYPPDSGPKVKTYNVLKYLAQHHEVTLASFVRGDQERDVEHLKQFCVGSVHTVPMERGAVNDATAMARSIAANQPWMMVRDDRAEMRALIDRLAREARFDVAHANSKWRNTASACQRHARFSTRTTPSTGGLSRGSAKPTGR